MNFQNPNYSTKNSRDSGSKIGKKENFREKIWVYLARLPYFRKFGKCCGRKESRHCFFFQINSLYNACVIFQKNGTLQQYKLILLTFYWLLFFLHVIQLLTLRLLSNLCRYGMDMKSRISKRPAYCLKETLDSRAVVLSCPFSDLLFPC